MVKFTLSGLLVAAACISLMGTAWACQTEDVVHVSLRGTIVQSQTVDDKD